MLVIGDLYTVCILGVLILWRQFYLSDVIFDFYLILWYTFNNLLGYLKFTVFQKFIVNYLKRLNKFVGCLPVIFFVLSQNSLVSFQMNVNEFYGISK